MAMLSAPFHEAACDPMARRYAHLRAQTLALAAPPRPRPPARATSSNRRPCTQRLWCVPARARTDARSQFNGLRLARDSK